MSKENPTIDEPRVKTREEEVAEELRVRQPELDRLEREGFERKIEYLGQIAKEIPDFMDRFNSKNLRGTEVDDMLNAWRVIKKGLEQQE